MHPQTLRQYDRVGLVTPGRTTGGGRRYSARDITVLRMVQRLSQDEGINLAGIKRIIDLENQVAALQGRVRELVAEIATIQHRSTAAEAAVHASYRRDLVPFRTTDGTIVPWRRR
jgi:MerR family transcriptional regulator/heat shock protein HspR